MWRGAASFLPVSAGEGSQIVRVGFAHRVEGNRNEREAAAPTCGTGLFAYA